MKPSAYRWNLAALQALAPQPSADGPYPNFQRIDGSHPWKYAVPNGFIEYQARILKKSKVVYFNFALAKEMGLIDKNHPHQLNKELEQAIINTFALRIINEYDQLTGLKVPAKEMKQNRYMATRYLQLQHDCKLGTTSGDGRSIWNGQFLGANGISWDVSSCGTGVTRLSPGSVHEGRPVRTGDKIISYGSGLADVDEGVTAAILSESFHSRGILTERTLVVLEGPEGHGINVRAAKNLLRPSHLFLHLKQGNQLMLKSALDFHISKQVHNRELAPPRDSEKYEAFLDQIAVTYGEFVARLEDEYIFCWLDWDGDNMLMGGGIIDYGSIRQLGLCHHHYRYDDVDRFSTNLKEQRAKAKYLVQTFVQLVDFVKTGQKKHLRHFAENKHLDLFEKTYRSTLQDCLLKRVGLNEAQRARVKTYRPDLLADFEKQFRFFERKDSNRGLKKTPDGVNNPAIFCARSLLRELPRSLLLREKELETSVFLNLMSTPFLTKKELKRTSFYQKPVEQFQRTYLELLRFAYKGKPLRRALLETAMRASQSNRLNYASGDGILYVVDEILAKRKQMNRNEFVRLVDSLIHHQQGMPLKAKLRKSTRRLLESLLRTIEETRHSI